MTRLIAAGLALYLLIFLLFYPPICGIEDEQGFVNQAIFWSRGALSAEGAGLSIHLGDLMPIGGRHLPIRHPGRSFATLPFYMAGGYQAIFISGIFLHAGLVLLASATLRRMNLPQNLALLVLFHPTLLIYSRTITADAAAGTGLLLAVYAFCQNGTITRRDLCLAGLGVGLAATMRHHAAAAAPGLCMVVYLKNSRPKDCLLFALACLVSALPLLAFNLVAYGSLLDPFSAGRGLFSLKYLAGQLPFYAESLSLFWPLMFFAPFLLLNRQNAAIPAVCLSFLAMLGCYYFHDSSPSRLQTDIIGLRLMQVALPAWIIGYSQVVQRFAPILARFHRLDKFTGILFLLMGSMLTFAIFDRHQTRLVDYAQRRQALLNSATSGGFLLTEGLVHKLVGIYRADQPDYEPHQVTFQSNRSYDEQVLQQRLHSGTPVYLAFSPNAPDQQPSAIFVELQSRLKALPVETGNSLMQVWRVPR
ncbi:MAG: hypothetical protein ACKO85_12060 [Isosphaeraceae bacterium]